MNLPTIETPQYTCMIPIAQKEVTYRPFLVGEQKSILVSQEADDTKNSLREVIRLIVSCTSDNIDVMTLSPVDLEFLFLQIRIVSVGETSDVGQDCKECGEENEVQINYLSNRVMPPGKEVDKILKINENLLVELKAPTLLNMAEIQDKYGSDITEEDTLATFAMLNKCISKIIHGDEVLTRDDFSDEDLDKFLEGMTLDMLNYIMEYLANQPKLVIPNDFICKHCEAKNTNLIEGLQNFFA